MPQSYEVDIEEVEYLRHGEKPLMARVYKPRGKGPFPAVVEAHGGAWVEGNRNNNEAINLPVAQGGVVVFAIDFRCPPDATYPASVADMHYAVRWVKAQAARFNTRAELVGTMGTSSGGHLAVLVGMKPDDVRYSAIPLADAKQDARVPYVVALWPVICPFGRWMDRIARESRNEPGYRSRNGHIQEQYWLTKEAMAEGSPNLALQRGDKIHLPNMIYLQNPADTLHPRSNLDSFVAGYRQAGGNVQLEFFEGKSYDLVRTDPDSEQARAAIAKIVKFIHAQAGSGSVEPHDP